ncbi:MAG: hypothetical protein JWN69_30 [Alphaproteobacteria bacterium]|nr:hypothetical protein [Alphaproteobacteria bacterium]
MKKTFVRNGVSTLIAGLLLAGPQAAFAKKKAPPPPPPAAPAPSNSDEWALIGLTPALVASATQGSGSIVALLDGRTDCTHADLAGRCQNVAIAGGRYRLNDPHGTHTAGIIAGTKYGVAPGARIINYGVFDDLGYVATGTKLISAWRDAGAKGATIASMSFGCSTLALCFTGDEVRAMADPNLKMLFVKAAGNDGTNLSNEAIAVSAADAAAAMARTILVGSIELNGTMSSFSNRPGEGCLLSSGASVCSPGLQWKNYFIVAPGRSIFSTLPGQGYGYMSGTSMATPVVAGVAALLEARWPTLKSSPESVARILLTSATDLGAPGVDGVYGWGLLNVGRAFQAQGNVTLVSAKGVPTVVTGSSTTASATLARLAAALGPVTVYDVYGRDFALAETNALQVRSDRYAMRQLLGRALLGMGAQADWASAFFASRHAPRGFAMFNSPAEPSASLFSPDRSLRMGVDMPFKGGVAQLRITGASASRLDFAYDPSLRPLSFFASTGLIKSALFAHALVNVSANGRLSIYGTTTSAGSISAAAPDQPLFDQLADRDSATRLALTGSRVALHQSGVGMGYWLQPDEHTVIGFNGSMLAQRGGYYDMVSDLPAFGKQTRMLNLGAAVSRRIGSWEASLSGEATHLRTAASSAGLRLTPANIVSAEVRMRKSGIAFRDGSLSDSLGLALVMPPRAVSGTLAADYMTRSEDGLGRVAAAYRYPLSRIGADPVKLEAAYQLSGGSSWSFDVSGGLNLRHSDYGGEGEALASLRLSL